MCHIPNIVFTLLHAVDNKHFLCKACDWSKLTGNDWLFLSCVWGFFNPSVCAVLEQSRVPVAVVSQSWVGALHESCIRCIRSDPCIRCIRRAYVGTSAPSRLLANKIDKSIRHPDRPADRLKISRQLLRPTPKTPTPNHTPLGGVFSHFEILPPCSVSRSFSLNPGGSGARMDQDLAETSEKPHIADPHSRLIARGPRSKPLDQSDDGK